jgi:heme/copper-type cytochrome/quinol oxidase subunit 2
MRKHRRKILLLLGAWAVCRYGLVPRAAAEGPAAARTIELIADKDNRFKFPDGQKGPLTLKSGEVIKFKVTSHFGGEKAKDGAVHSFVVRKLRDNDPAWSVRLKEGVQEFTVTAPKPGNYLIECTVECGPNHDNMNMKMVVTK